ncbi:MAG: glycosyltransferase [Bacteroidetes bacterium]|nr:glycosyltransferase [Bacteroidota bacterium]
MANNILVSVIISVYNRIDYLKLVLAGFENQSFNNFEIVLADDGSDKNAVKEIKSLIDKISLPAYHIWHEDNGFRKNRILNRAIQATNTDYLIIIDGDCIPHSEFVKEHFQNRKEKTCLTGRRINLSQKITDTLNEERIKSGYLERNYFKLMIDGVFGNSTDVEKGLYFKNHFLRIFFNEKYRGLLGSNFSIHKNDILAINGFDERYEAPSVGEDTDIQFRLELNGVKIKSLNQIAIQYHLFHELQPRPQKNLDLFEKIKADGHAITRFGIIKDLS